MKKQAGFSLVELMIVVAIIGILATIAIPNFQRFQAKARQSEGRNSLAGYFSAQKAFFSEWSIYPGQFPAAGYRPEGTLNYRITAANNAAGIAALTNYGGPNVATCISTNGCVAADFGGALPYTESNMATSSVLGGCAPAAAGTPATAGTFLTCASTLMSGATQSDVWSINQIKTVVQVQSGLP